MTYDEETDALRHMYARQANMSKTTSMVMSMKFIYTLRNLSVLKIHPFSVVDYSLILYFTFNDVFTLRSRYRQKFNL